MIMKKIKYWIIFKLLRFDPYELNDHGYYITSTEQWLLEVGA